MLVWVRFGQEVQGASWSRLSSFRPTLPLRAGTQEHAAAGGGRRGLKPSLSVLGFLLPWMLTFCFVRNEPV